MKKLSIEIVSGTKETFLVTDVCVVNYDILPAHHGELRAVQWDLIICDECHALKNETTGRTQQVFGGGRKRLAPLRAKRWAFLTGTPILNKPRELWPLLKSIDPTGLGADKDKFAKRYCQAFWMEGRGLWWDGAGNLEELQAYMRSKFMIRRLKADVLKDLPAKRRQVIVLEPDKSLAGDLKKELKTYEEHASELAGKDPIALNFEGLSEIRKEIALKKVPYVVEHLKEVLNEQDKVVVFGHHHEVTDALAAAFGSTSVVVDGRVPNEERQRAVDRFQSDSTCKIFIGGIQSAGVGLTLTAASTVVFAELDWVPGNMSQAEDRCHRIGQKEQVLVQHIVLANSLDERMAETIIKKQEIIEKALDRVAS
jgi:SWI/SNF-related matrix-associated actin-dependent regulator 1 of chromatin subfamily A